jgi:crossover junction endodeoxyribonuclease RusA
VIELPYPAHVLWPNARPHWAAKHRAAKKHREWARLAVLADDGRPFFSPSELIQLIITLYPKTRNAIDRDNALAAMKAYQDGISDAIRVNDSNFLTTRLQFGEPVKNGKVVIEIQAS